MTARNLALGISGILDSELPRIRISPVLVRYLLREYMQRIFVVLAAILAVGLGMDLLENWQQVAARAGLDTLGGPAGLVVWYAALRAVDIATQFLAIAAFLGVLWCELRLERLNERTAMITAGESPLGALVPAAILAVILGVAQLSLDVKFRPAAVTRQIAAGLGEIGTRYDHRLSQGLAWARINDGILSARIDDRRPGVLHDVTIYRLSPSGRLREVIKAPEGTRTDMPGKWRLEGAVNWSAGQGGFKPTAHSGGKSDLELFDIDFDPVLFKAYGVTARYLPADILYRLALGPGEEPPVSEYKTWIQLRYLRALVPGLLALLAATLAPLVLGHRTMLRYFVVVFAGYGAHFAVRTCGNLGEIGYLSAAAAAWSGPVIIAAAVVAIQAVRRNRIF